MKDSNLRSKKKFYYICKIKAAESIAGLQFNVSNTLSMPQASQISQKWLATQSRKFENKLNKTRIWTVSTLKLTPGMNLVALFTYTVKFSDLKLDSFMVYTYNIQGQ